MVSYDQIYQHFNADEHQLIEKLRDLIQQLDEQYSIQLTGFLDPRQVSIARSVLGQAGVTYYVSNEDGALEYSRILLAPDYYELDWEDFEVSLIEIAYQGKFSQLSHSQILGSLLNGLGLKRQVIGDVLVAEGYAQVVVDRKMLGFILEHTEKMARTGVRLKEIPWSERLSPKLEEQAQLVLVSSLRLDKLIAVAHRVSRQQAQAMIVAGKTKLNYQVMTKPDHLVQVGDLISTRGFGRVRIMEDLGLTKTGKHKLMLDKSSKK